MIQNIPIIDFHCHFPFKGTIGFPDYPTHKHPEFDVHGARNHGEIWRKAYNFPLEQPDTTPEKMADLWADDV